VSAPAVGAEAPLLSVSGLTKRYGQRAALRDVAFELRRGELVGVVGPNGAGKTTLLSIIAGVKRQSAGAVALGRSRGRPPAIGWAPQQAAVYGKLTVRENLVLFARLARAREVARVVARVLDRAGLSARAEERVEALSGGNRQRLNVALALLDDPQLLLLDEPSAALDPGQRGRLWRLIGSLVDDAHGGAGTSVLFSTHHLGEVHRYASRMIVLADGELLFDGPPAQLPVAGGEERDLEAAFVAFLAERGRS
jgi:ABC-2 type transport system ATP-binding protein